MTIADITRLCRAYADALTAMEELTGEIQEERRKIVRLRMRRLMERAARVSATREDLVEAVKSAPMLFDQPRTRSLEGIKVGFRKLPGKIEIADEARTITRVRQKLPEMEDALVVARETLDRNALKKKLSVKQLASIGVRLTDDEDEVVVRAAGTDIDKLVEALLADVDEEVAAMAAHG